MTWAPMKLVSKEEFDAFVKAYPRRLSFDICGVGEPPLATLNDFTLGNWPESVVASYFSDGGYHPELGPHNWKILGMITMASEQVLLLIIGSYALGLLMYPVLKELARRRTPR